MWLYLSKCVYLILMLESLSCCCDCDKKKRENHDKIKKYSMSELIGENVDIVINALDKRQLYKDDDNILSTQATETTTTTELEYKEEQLDTKETATGTITEIVNEGQTVQINVEGDLVDRCPYFKNGYEFDLTKISDVWEIVYHQMPQRLSCFKIHLKIMTVQERNYYEKLYGSFNNRVDWQKCILQIKTGQKNNVYSTKHFLQGSKKDKGLMENIVLIEESNEHTTTVTLRPESPDQWLLIKDLLLMRDCDDGGLVVFARVPYQPRWVDIQDALIIFGEEKINGTFGCGDTTDKIVTFGKGDRGRQLFGNKI